MTVISWVYITKLLRSPYGDRKRAASSEGSMFFFFRKHADDEWPKGPPNGKGYGGAPDPETGPDWEPDVGSIDIDRTVKKAKSGDDEAFSDLVIY